MGKTLTGEVFEEVLAGLKDWLESGLDKAERNEVFKFAKDYFIDTSFSNRFGTEIDVQKEVSSIKEFYEGYFKTPSEKMNFFKKYFFSKKYQELKKKSLEIAISRINGFGDERDIVDDARKILGETEKNNYKLEKEDESVQRECFRDANEIFLNCTYAITGDKDVLGNEIGEIIKWREIVKTVYFE